MKKAIQYAYPTSQKAKELNEGKSGCYYVTRHESDPLNPAARVSCTAKDIATAKHLASLAEGEFFTYCGKVQDGRNFPS